MRKNNRGVRFFHYALKEYKMLNKKVKIQCHSCNLKFVDNGQIQGY